MGKCPKEGHVIAFVNLRKVPLFQGLTDPEFDALRSCFREKSFGRGELLFLEGKPCERVYVVKEGRVKVYRVSAGGREQILQILEPGDTCACNPGSSSWTCSSTSEAITRCSVWYLSRDAYLKLVQSNSEFLHSLNRLFADRLKCFSSLIEEVSLKDSKKRLVRFLLDIAGAPDQKDRSALSVPFTREEIAQRIGTARETVARSLYQLKRGKLIEVKPRMIILLNKPALQKIIDNF